MDNPDYTAPVREDFDRIVSHPEEKGWDHNFHYHGFLLGPLPPRLGKTLEVGCGTGAHALAGGAAGASRPRTSRRTRSRSREPARVGART